VNSLVILDVYEVNLKLKTSAVNVFEKKCPGTNALAYFVCDEEKRV
jgi:hypothetical protein